MTIADIRVGDRLRLRGETAYDEFWEVDKVTFRLTPKGRVEVSVKAKKPGAIAIFDEYPYVFPYGIVWVVRGDRIINQEEPA